MAMVQRLPRQLSLFGVEARPPSPLDLEGLLAGAGQVTRMGGTARVSIMVDAPWRAAALRAESALRGLVSVTEPPDADGFIRFRTAYSAALAPLSARWLRDAVKHPPERFVLDGRRLRLWVIAAGSPEGAQGFVLRLTPPEPPLEREPQPPPEREPQPPLEPEPESPIGHEPEPPPEREGAQESARDSAKASARAGAQEPARGSNPEAARSGEEAASGEDASEIGIAEVNPLNGRIAQRRELDWDVAAVGAALASAGLPAVLVAPKVGGPAYRIVGRRRLARLAELIGEPPAQAPPGEWPV